MKRFRRPLVPALPALLLLFAGCGTPQTPVRGGLQRNRPERMLIENRFASATITAHVSPEAMITRFIRELSERSLTLRLEKPAPKSARLLLFSPRAEGYVQLNKQQEIGMTFTVEYEYRIKIRRFPSTEEQEAEVNRLADYIQVVLTEAQRPPTNGAEWKD